MALTIKAFKATYYNPEAIKDYSRVICPPYDVISKLELARLRKKSVYNFSKILIADDGDYLKSASQLKTWLTQKILIDDPVESLYLYEQKFKVEGRNFWRYGLLSLLDMNQKGIFPHEHTLAAPKEDRKQIIASTKANLSPIFVIAAKELTVLKQVYLKYRKLRPLFKCRDSAQVFSRVWRICERKEISSLAAEIAKSPLVIADGHHRFETSLDYFRKNKTKFRDLNYILAYTAGYQPGLVILPTHRVMEISEREDVFFRKLSDYFQIKSVSKNELQQQLEKSPIFSMGIYRQGKFYFLRLKDKAILDKIFNKLFRKLDTCVFHALVLPLFKPQGQIEYTHSVKEAKALAAKNKVAFLLRAVPLELVLKISSQGFRLPQKTTYFYPKLLSGLVIRRFQEK